MTYLPHREAELLNWSRNFDALITADPATYGLDALQATAYTTFHHDFVNAYQAAIDPGTRTPASVQTKNDAKRALIAEARRLARIIQAFPGTTNTERIALGLTVPDPEPTPIPVPDIAPEIDLISAVGRTVRLRIHNEATLETRGKPQGVAGATIFSHIGTLPPAPQDLHLWTFEQNTTTTTIDLLFPSTVPPGATAWITAFWFNPRAERGPTTAPVSIQIPGTLTQAA